MAGDSIGEFFRVTNWGESHGKAIGVVVEGCPPGLSIDEKMIQKELDFRKPGQSNVSTPRKEEDCVKILSGVTLGKTTGAAISMMIENRNQKPLDYDNMKFFFRPSHADYTYFSKYGIREVAGGGRSSARITAGTVAAGAIAKMVLQDLFQCNFFAFVLSVGEIKAKIHPKDLTLEQREKNVVRCPDLETAEEMKKFIEKMSREGDSAGGIVECHITNVPVGLGTPVYDKLDADLAKVILGINACKGFEIGTGFSGTRLRGSLHNDAFVLDDHNKVKTETNNSGGVQGGISNGMPIVFRAAFKPTSTIRKQQKTLSVDFKEQLLKGEGRHDTCVLPRAVPIVEASAAIVLADHALRHRGQMGKFPN